MKHQEDRFPIMTGRKTGTGVRLRGTLAAVSGHPGALGSLGRLLQLCRMGPIDLSYVPRLLAVAFTNALSSPLRLWERTVYARAIARTPLHPSPIFVLGHWRSGTTHLQNLICQDSSLGYLTGFQAIAPGFCLMGRGRVQRLIGKMAEPRNRTRPMDRVPFSLDTPQEEELALANMTVHSFSHAFVLPRQAEAFFQRYVLMEDLPESTVNTWRDLYLQLLRKVTLASGGKRLILKNVTNTTRIPMLLDLFPDAKFVFIHRNPYDVFTSTAHLHESLLSICQLQGIGSEQVESNVLEFYPRFMRKYLADRSLIPPGNLVEIGYAELVEDPLRVLRGIYESFDLADFECVEAAFRSYLNSIRGYKKNDYDLSPGAISQINDRWGFAFDEWNYDVR